MANQKPRPDPDQLLEQVKVPARKVTSCMFGGQDMNELHITSNRTGISEVDLKKFPLPIPGGLFRVKTNVTGMRTLSLVVRPHSERGLSGWI